MADDAIAPFQSDSHDHGSCISHALEVAEELCADRGQRLTVLRRRVLELVWRRHEPVRAYDLLDRLRADQRNAAPPTVYRALDFLLANGLVHRIESLNAYVGCGKPRSPHAGQFLICERCSTVAELAESEISRIVTRTARSSGFTVSRQTIEVIGLCPECDGGDGRVSRAF